MQEGLKKNIKKQIKILEDYLRENQKELTQDEIDEVLDELDKLYELLKFYD